MTSSCDEPAGRHVQGAEMMIDKAKRPRSACWSPKGAAEKNRQNQMKRNRWPQDNTGQATRGSEVGEVQRGQRVVSGHADERRAGPASNAERDKGNAGETSDRGSNTGEVFAE